jgi:hypothetical protein
MSASTFLRVVAPSELPQLTDAEALAPESGDAPPAESDKAVRFGRGHSTQHGSGTGREKTF